MANSLSRTSNVILKGCEELPNLWRFCTIEPYYEGLPLFTPGTRIGIWIQPRFHKPLYVEAGRAIVKTCLVKSHASTMLHASNHFDIIQQGEFGPITAKALLLNYLEEHYHAGQFHQYRIMYFQAIT